MDILQKFRPHLTGRSVLRRHPPGRYAEIDLQLFADSAKEVEIFLLNRAFPTPTPHRATIAPKRSWSSKATMRRPTWSSTRRSMSASP